jgi:outer membrane protein
MKRTSVKLAAAVVIGLAMGGTALAQDKPMKFGYVDIQKAIQATEAGKKAKKELEGEFNKKKKVLEAKEKDLNDMRTDLEKKAMVLSDEVRDKRRAELQEEFMKYQKLASESQQSIQTRERELTGPIVEKMLKVVNKLADKEGYSMIFVKNDQTLLWARKELEMTDRLVTEFEKEK